VHPKIILIYIQQDATLHSLFYLETALHISGGTSTHHQERKRVYLQHLVFVTPLLLPAAITLDGHLLRVTIPDAVLIQYDLLRMSKILLETYTCIGL
jgi:hypothetical protein